MSLEVFGKEMFPVLYERLDWIKVRFCGIRKTLNRVNFVIKVHAFKFIGQIKPLIPATKLG